MVSINSPNTKINEEVSSDNSNKITAKEIIKATQENVKVRSSRSFNTSNS